MSASPHKETSGNPTMVRRPHPVRDNVEGLLFAVVLALIVRCFVVEIFVIPTGSMAPTLLGQHRDLSCPNCTREFAVDAAYNKVEPAECPNCGYVFSAATVRNRFCSCCPSWPQPVFYRGGNRVAVNKFDSQFTRPKRWDIVVFRFPIVRARCRACGHIEEDMDLRKEERVCAICGSKRLRIDQKNYIKRLIGLPGEKVEIRHGDIYVNKVLERKPPEVQENLWQFVYDSQYPIRAEQGFYEPRWVVETGTFDGKDDSYTLRPSEEGIGRVQYRPPVKNYNAYNGKLGKEKYKKREDLGDLRLSVWALLDGPGNLRLEIKEDQHVYVATVRFGEGRFRTALHADGEEAGRSDMTLDPSREAYLAFSNVDNLLALCVNGETVLEFDCNTPIQETNVTDTTNNHVALGVEGATARISRVRIERDIYYAIGGSDDKRELITNVEVPQKSYFVLGDNTHRSADSRFWGFVPAENMIGTTNIVWWPLNHLMVVK